MPKRKNICGICCVQHTYKHMKNNHNGSSNSTWKHVEALVVGEYVTPFNRLNPFWHATGRAREKVVVATAALSVNFVDALSVRSEKHYSIWRMNMGILLVFFLFADWVKRECSIERDKLHCKNVEPNNGHWKIVSLDSIHNHGQSHCHMAVMVMTAMPCQWQKRQRQACMYYLY